MVFYSPIARGNSGHSSAYFCRVKTLLRGKNKLNHSIFEYKHNKDPYCEVNEPSYEMTQPTYPLQYSGYNVPKPCR